MQGTDYQTGLYFATRQWLPFAEHRVTKRLARRQRLARVLLLFISCYQVASAQDATPNPAPAASARSLPDHVGIQLDDSTSGLDQRALLDAIRGELGSDVQVTQTPADHQLFITVSHLPAEQSNQPTPTVATTNQATVASTTDKAREAVALIRYEEPTGRVVTRRFALPSKPTERRSAIALLAGNLVRNEAAEILAGLQQPPGQSTAALEEPPPPSVDDAGLLPLVRFNASLLHPLSLDPDSHRSRIDLELGFAFSNIGELDGAQATLGVAYIHGAATGISLSGLTTIVRGPFMGFQATGGLGYVGGALHGTQLAAGVAVAGIEDNERPSNSAVPRQSASTSDPSDSQSRVQIAGIATASQGSGRLVQIASTANLHYNGEVQGLQLGGLNLADRLDGPQLGAVNLGKYSTVAVGAVNIANENDVAIGAVNVMSSSNVMIGAINVAEEAELAIGVVNIVGNARYQPIGWYSLGDGMRVGLRTQFPRWYTQFWIGGDFFSSDTEEGIAEEGDAEDRENPFTDDRQADTDAEAGVALGYRWEFDPFYVAADIGTFVDYESDPATAHFGQLRGSGAVGVELLDWVGVFAGVAPRLQWHRDDALVLEYFAGAHLF